MKGIDFDALAQWAESDEPSISPDAVIHRGTAASQAEALKMLQDAADTPAEQEALKALGGRPRLDPEGAASLIWRVRVPGPLDASIRALAAAEGKKFPEVLRSAVREYISNHHPQAS